MAARITMSVTPDGEFELWLNEEGRDRFIRELSSLSATNDHFHLGAFEGAGVEMSRFAYRQTDKVIYSAKVMLRLDEWDRTHFPQVLTKLDDDR